MVRFGARKKALPMRLRGVRDVHNWGEMGVSDVHASGVEVSVEEPACSTAEAIFVSFES